MSNEKKWRNRHNEKIRRRIFGDCSEADPSLITFDHMGLKLVIEHESNQQTSGSVVLVNN